MLDNNRERLELAFSLLFTLPGTPMLQYGDEIGMGDNLSLPERECARTPMQWSSGKQGGFSSSRRVVRPVVSDPIYGYKRVNVNGQRRDPHSLLNWMERKIRMRRECPEISWGDWKIVATTEPGVLIMRYEHEGCASLRCTISPRSLVRLGSTSATAGHRVLVDLLGTNDSRVDASGRHVIELPPYAYRWYRPGGLDGRLARHRPAE